MRARAVWCCLWYGVWPWWMYERAPHYGCGYWAHLWLNLRYAARWVARRETREDREFELAVNARPARRRRRRRAGTAFFLPGH